MSYLQLQQIADMMPEQRRLVAYSQYYRSLTIQGLHFVHFVPSQNAIAVCTPTCQTHAFATAYLLLQKDAYVAINTVRGEATNLKKFLDFLMLWDVDLLAVDLLVLLQAFTDYLRLLPADHRPRDVLEWTLLDQVPLHEKAQTAGQVIRVQRDDTGRLRPLDWSEYSGTRIRDIVSTAVKYLIFLQTRTEQYAKLPVKVYLPIKERFRETDLSGTLGRLRTEHVNVAAIIGNASGIRGKREVEPLPPDAIFSQAEAERFLSSITSPLDKLLFNIMLRMGLRRSEAAGLKLDLTSLPTNLRRMEIFEAMELLKTKLRGDIQFIPTVDGSHGAGSGTQRPEGHWWCRVVDRGNPHYQAGHKSAETRDVPWLPEFRQATFLHLLYEALLEREQLIQYVGTDHGFLFVSRDHKARGRPVTGAGVGRKYDHVVAGMVADGDDAMLDYSPHTLRHFFPSHALRVLKRPLDDVSRWLGHRSTETTRTIYLHYIPGYDEHPNSGTVADMASTLARYSSAKT